MFRDLTHNLLSQHFQSGNPATVIQTPITLQIKYFFVENTFIQLHTEVLENFPDSGILDVITLFSCLIQLISPKVTGLCRRP